MSFAERIAIIGGGPAATYLLLAFFNARQRRSNESSDRGAALHITIFERSDAAGRGTPYHPDVADTSMLSNISSRELPPIGETLLDWLKHKPEEVLTRYGLDRRVLSEEQYYPRLLLGEYFEAKFYWLVSALSDLGHDVEVRTQHTVTDVVPIRRGNGVLSLDSMGRPATDTFDTVVVATGHGAQNHEDRKPGETARACQVGEEVGSPRLLPSPYPAARLERIRGPEIGILGTSLSAVDAMASLAQRFGKFERHEGQQTRYTPHTTAAPFCLTLMSRKGILPEIDFYHPLPWHPLRIFTVQAVEALAAETAHGLLQRCFSLFLQELASSCGETPLEAARLATFTPRSFHDFYFSERQASDPVEWARRTLRVAREDYEKRQTDAFKYTVLRAHPVFEHVLGFLDGAELAEFHAWLKPVFIDNYAALPHESIERLLALSDAGCLKVLKLGHSYTLEANEDGVSVSGSAGRRHYDTLIDATGQKELRAADLPFPVLAASLALPEGLPLRVRPEGTVGEAIRTGDDFGILSEAAFVRNVYLLSAPFLLHELPFSQGLEPLSGMATIVAEAILARNSSSAAPDPASEMAPGP